MVLRCDGEVVGLRLVTEEPTPRSASPLTTTKLDRHAAIGHDSQRLPVALFGLARLCQSKPGTSLRTVTGKEKRRQAPLARMWRSGNSADPWSESQKCLGSCDSALRSGHQRGICTTTVSEIESKVTFSSDRSLDSTRVCGESAGGRMQPLSSSMFS